MRPYTLCVLPYVLLYTACMCKKMFISFPSLFYKYIYCVYIYVHIQSVWCKWLIVVCIYLCIHVTMYVHVASDWEFLVTRVPGASYVEHKKGVCMFTECIHHRSDNLITNSCLKTCSTSAAGCVAIMLKFQCGRSTNVAVCVSFGLKSYCRFHEQYSLIHKYTHM